MMGTKLSVHVWGAVLSGYAYHGKGKEPLLLFEEMLKERIKPDEVTFISLLSACSHAGLVVEAKSIFHDMKSLYGIAPGPIHYNCLMDVLARAGDLDSAEQLLETTEPTPIM